MCKCVFFLTSKSVCERNGRLRAGRRALGAEGVAEQRAHLVRTAAELQLLAERVAGARAAGAQADGGRL